MKYFLKFTIIVVLLITSCTIHNKDVLINRLDEIKAMGDTLPLIAMEQLDSIRPLLKDRSDYVQNKISLLDIRLRDKAFISHTSSEVIKEVCNYFEKNGTAKDIQESYYYMGSVYRDLNDYPQAITYFLKSVGIAETNEYVDIALWENAYSQLSYLYKMFNYSEALDASLKQLNVAEANGTIAYITDRHLLLGIYKERKRFNGVLHAAFIEVTAETYHIVPFSIVVYLVAKFHPVLFPCSIVKDKHPCIAIRPDAIRDSYSHCLHEPRFNRKNPEVYVLL